MISIPLPDVVLVVVIALACTVLVGGTGGLVLLRLRSRPLSWLLGGLTGITVVSVVVAVLAATRAMFISAHDATITVVVVLAAGVAAWGVAILLGRVVVRAAGQLAASARTMTGLHAYTPPTVPLTAELREVADEMAAADERLRTARTREVALETSRRELVAWVSHDLRSPLAGIRAMAEALEDGVVHERADVDRYHTGIRREADRLATMVGDLFELSRIHAGALRLVVGTVGVDDLVSDVVASADPVARSKGVRLEGSASGGGRATLDATEMSRVLLNLVTNAIRHTPTEGAVQVTGSVVDGHACFAVTDACGGIPAEDLQRVFDVAFRGEAARTPTASVGAGLGLAIARGIVEAHDGEIAVQNVGSGCRFEIRIPQSG